MLFMPPFNAILTVVLMDVLLSLRPANPVRLAVCFHAHHLLRSRQVRINGRRKGMNQFWPCLVPEPEHGGAVAAEVALRAAFLLIGLATVFDGYIFPILCVLEMRFQEMVMVPG
jgi:hypothetical protein